MQVIFYVSSGAINAPGHKSTELLVLYVIRELSPIDFGSNRYRTRVKDLISHHRFPNLGQDLRCQKESITIFYYLVRYKYT